MELHPKILRAPLFLGLLATPGTVKRQYVQNLIDSFASHCKVTKVGSAELVHEAENKLRGLPVDEQVIAQALAPFNVPDDAPDTIVLGCTHFPFLREEILRHLPASTRLIDSGEAIARRAVALMQDIAPSPTTLNDNEFLFTADTAGARKMAETLHLHGFPQVHVVANGITEFTQKRSAT